MSKTRGFLLAAAVAAMVFTFSCSSEDDDGGGNTPGSSSVGAQGGGSSSSGGGNQSLSSSSASAPSSSPSTEPLTCSAVPASGYATVQITPPALTCGNGQKATGINWVGLPPNWNNPKEGTYSDISVMANCGTATNLMASCPGTLTVQPMISCSMATRTGYEGTAITTPVISCSDGSVPSGIVFSGYFPNWDNPAVGSYAVLAEANCGHGNIPAISCGTLTVNEVTLTCGSVPVLGYESVAISPPALTCSHGILGTPNWVNAPNWSNPTSGTYSDISVTVACGLASKTANCSGSLSVSCSGNNNTSTHYCSNGTMKAYGFVTHGEQTYKTVVIGTQTWMAENLNYNPGTGNSACYDNQASYCTTYGRLYDWSTAMGLPSSCNSSSCSNQIQSKHRGVCPSGWHLPSYTEWDVLMTAVGGSNTAGTKLKATNGWNSYDGVSGNGADGYGFSALPGGYGYSDGSFYPVGYNGTWWSANEHEDNSSYAYYRYMGYYYGNAYWGGDSKSFLFSVRCVQD